MSTDTINVGLIGYKFMGKAHSAAYRDVVHYFNPKIKPVMKVICGRNEEGVKEAQEQFGWEEYETSWQKVVERDDIRLIDISTPNFTHYQIAIQGAKAGKHLLCEKPLAIDSQQAEEMHQAAEEAGVKHMVCFNYRRVPAVTLAKQLIDKGYLGNIYHFRATYLQDWIVDTSFPLVWRLKREYAGSGAHGDLNAHLIDLARYLVGEIDAVTGMSKTFIKTRPMPEEEGSLAAEGGKERGEVTVDDATLFLARFKGGAIGSFEATRFATGRKNYNRFEINGSKGSLVFNLERMNELELYSKEDPTYARGFKTILATEPDHPYVGNWWPPGHIIGYQHSFVHTVYDLLNCIAEDRMPEPNFYDGMRCQQVLNAVSRSAEEGGWVKV